MTEPASAPTSAELVETLIAATIELGIAKYGNDEHRHSTMMRIVGEQRERLLARLAAYDALAAAARVVVAGYDRFGCRELRAALAQLDRSGTE